MERNTWVNYNLQTTPLEIKTNSVTGSDHKMKLLLRSAQGEDAGAIVFKFFSTLSYHIGFCYIDSPVFPTETPSATEKIWRITLTKNSNIKLVVHCNDVEVLNTLISESTCPYSGWKAQWNKNVGKIAFASDDTAADFYRPQPQPGNSL